jgi:hypothetical protein
MTTRIEALPSREVQLSPACLTQSVRPSGRFVWIQGEL